MLVQGIKSRPVYSGLTIDTHAARHLFALEGEGAAALIEKCGSGAREFLAKSEILYAPVASKPKDYEARLQSLKALDLWAAPSVPVLLHRLKATLQTARMGIRLYVAGTEGFIGQATQVAVDCGIDFNSIVTEYRGSAARRVQCVHCKGVTDNVTTSPFTCSRCGLPLLVRDHYSRRIAAFQGVNIDAEVPGTAPAPEELFP